MKAFSTYTLVSDATRLLRENTVLATSREVVPTALAFGRTISRDIVAGSDIPLADSSHMDGFAVIAKDLEVANSSMPVKLKLRAGVGAGKFPRTVLRNGEACAILTGGYLPAGADSVVPIELVRREGDWVTVDSRIERGSFVYAAGSDVRRGQAILQKGTTLRAQEVGLLASLHVGRVHAFRRPKVGIVATGSELTARIDRPPPGKVTETHSLVISRLIECAGGIAYTCGIAKDEKAAITGKLRRALALCDIVLTMAGTSLGGADITTNCINSLGKPGVLVHGVRIHRGRVMGVAAVRGKPIIILPGPIQGAVNAFLVFGYPLIRQFLGGNHAVPRSVRGVLTSDWAAKKGFEDFTKIVYLKLSTSSRGFQATPVVGETEKMTVLTESNAYAVIEEDVSSLERGASIDAHLLPGFSYADGRFLD